MSSDAKNQLVDFLNRKVFEPILGTGPDEYSSPSDKQKLDRVQRAARFEQRRYESERSAEEVRNHFLRELPTEAALSVEADLRHLGLPALSEIKEEFLSLCETLGVASSPDEKAA
jgi:hypothetical protein